MVQPLCLSLLLQPHELEAGSHRRIMSSMKKIAIVRSINNILQ